MTKDLFDTISRAIKKNRALMNGQTEEEFEQQEVWDALKKNHNPNYKDIEQEIQKIYRKSSE